MSYLSLPRLTFFGQSYANASTANNNDIASVLDVDNVAINPNTMQLMNAGGQPVPGVPGTFNWSSPSDNPQLRSWLMNLMTAPDLDVPQGQTGYGQMAHWNYYGDHETRFDRAYVTNVTSDSANGPVTSPLSNIRVELLGDLFYGKRRGGVLVDVDPYALITSQIFAGRFQLSYEVSQTVSLPLLVADQPTVAYSYFINPFKNLNPACTGFEPVSAVFQFGLPLAQIQFPAAAGFDSPAFAAFKQKVQASAGLVVRFCLYDAIFQIPAEQLSKDFLGGKYVSNPYQGRVLGSIGIWNQGELATAPFGRKLTQQTRFNYTPPARDLTEGEVGEKRRRMATVARYGQKPRPLVAGQASAAVGITLASADPANSRVSLDCISTFPEADIQQRNKFDLGTISLVLTSPNLSAPIAIGTVPNDKASYEAGGGVLDISYAANPQAALINQNLAGGQLSLVSSTYGPLIAETPFADAQTDDRAVYFDCKIGEGPGAVPGTAQIAVQVLQQGVPPANPTTLILEYWMCEKTYVDPSKVQVGVPTPYFSVAGASPQPPATYTLGYLAGRNDHNGNPIYRNNQTTVLRDQIMVPAGGRLTLNLTAIRAGVSMIRFVDPRSALTQFPFTGPNPNFAWDNCNYAVVRILPFDDFSGFTDLQINNWPFIYSTFFNYYSVIHPIMSTFIPWGPDDAPNDPQRVKGFADQMVQLTDEKLWRSTLYMPITRDLSGGKRKLLRRWCNLQQ